MHVACFLHILGLCKRHRHLAGGLPLRVVGRNGGIPGDDIPGWGVLFSLGTEHYVGAGNSVGVEPKIFRVGDFKGKLIVLPGVFAGQCSQEGYRVSDDMPGAFDDEKIVFIRSMIDVSQSLHSKKERQVRGSSFLRAQPISRPQLRLNAPGARRAGPFRRTRCLLSAHCRCRS